MTATTAPGSVVGQPHDDTTDKLGEARGSAPHRIAVLRALQLGDLLCAVPSLRALRRRFPYAHVTLISLPWARAFAERYRAYVDDFIEFPGWPGLPEREFDVTRVAEFLNDCHERHFDLAIQLHGSGSRVNEIVSLLGARRTAGFFMSGDHVPDDGDFVEWPSEGTEAQRLLRVMGPLGANILDDAPEFPVMETDEVELSGVLATIELPLAPYVCIHPGARFSSRRWPAERFAEVGDALAQRGFRVVLTGTRDEDGVTGAVRSAMRAPAIDLTGLLTLGALGALIARASLVVSNDTGVSHVTAGVRTPSVVVASGSDAARWRPGPTSRHRVLWHDVPCRPCGHHECPIGHPCARAVDTEMVLEEAARLLPVSLK